MGSIGIVGLGKQAEEYIEIIKQLPGWDITAVCDRDKDISSKVSSQLNAECYTSIEELAASQKCDIYFLCLPHNQYFNAMSLLSYPGCYFIKEKPFAIDLVEAEDTYSMLKKTGASCAVLLKRRFNPAYQAASNFISEVGNIYSAEFRYTLSVDRLDEGWRASKCVSGGGAVIDMGYHLIDLIVWYLGEPDFVTAKISNIAKPEQQYDVEDTAHILFEFPSATYNEHFICNAVISRCYGNKNEEVRLIGTNGIIIVTPKEMKLLSHHGALLKHIENNLSSEEILKIQISSLLNSHNDGDVENIEKLKHHYIIDAIYKSGETKTKYNYSRDTENKEIINA